MPLSSIGDTGAAALYLLRKLTSVSATSLAEQYGPVSQAAISKTVQRAEERCEAEQSWIRRIRKLEKTLRESQ